jgi:hypothetical protein
MQHQPKDKEEPETPGPKPDEREEGLASLLGKYHDDPTWEEFQEHIKEYRRQIDELNRE